MLVECWCKRHHSMDDAYFFSLALQTSRWQGLRSVIGKEQMCSLWALCMTASSLLFCPNFCISPRSVLPYFYLYISLCYMEWTSLLLCLFGWWGNEWREVTNKPEKPWFVSNEHHQTSRGKPLSIKLKLRYAWVLSMALGEQQREPQQHKPVSNLMT